MCRVETGGYKNIAGELELTPIKAVVYAMNPHENR